jgi:hypothetical protein
LQIELAVQILPVKFCYKACFASAPFIVRDRIEAQCTAQETHREPPDPFLTSQVSLEPW